MNTYNKIIFTLSITVVLLNTGCSSSDSGSVIPATSNWAAGIYTGTFTEDGSNTTDDVVLLVTSDNNFALATLDGAEYNIGTVSGSDLSTTAGFVATLDTALSGTYIAPPFSGTFTLVDAGLYDRTSSTAKLEGIWVDNNSPSSGPGTLTYTIENTGLFTLASTAGCTGTGSFSTIDSSKNEYTFTLVMTDCPGFNGTYNGYAITDDTFFTDDTIDIIAENIATPAFIISQAIKQ